MTSVKYSKASFVGLSDSYSCTNNICSVYILSSHKDKGILKTDTAAVSLFHITGF